MLTRVIYFILISTFTFHYLSAGLPELEQQALKELEYLDFPPQPEWVPQRKTSSNDHIYDVVIVGAGQTGITLAFALKREKINNIILFDEQEENH